MKGLYELKEMLCYEIEEIAKKGELTPGALETAHTLTDTIKNIDKIKMLEEYEDEYSADDDYSYARGRGRGRNAKRDSMGRYSRDSGYSRDGGMGGNMGGYGGGYSARYSRDDGKEHLMRDMREMMDEAKDERQREAYRRAMKELENI